ncbi:MAG TPA: site-specific DNA-methyltransferase [Trebonia sp.]|nr:site-specific DNA-methyltransferase [Trebonia sp.]
MTDPAIPVPPRRLRSPYWHRDTHSLYVGDAREVLAEMPDRSADCIVTSPPYWGKRDYGMARQYGREPDPASYVATLRATFTEARRVLADDGTCWLNLGDSYSASGGGPTGLHAYLGRHLGQPMAADVPAKNLLGLPWRVAFALQDDGWILRNAIIWHKPNAMPESVRDRLNCRYELLFLLVKQAAYWFDLNPIRIPPATVRPTTTRPPGRRDAGRPGKYGPHVRQVTGASRYGPGRARRVHPNGRNPGDVWAIPTRPYAGPHFAAFPLDLPVRCIAAGCKPGGTVLDPFTGSGTTGLAARQLRRAFTGIELSPAFAALAADRLTQAARPDDPGGRS